MEKAINSSAYQSTYLLLLYAFVALVNIVGNTLDIAILVYCSKPLLMSLLLFFYWKNRKEVELKFQRLIRFGLIFAFLGDVFLLFEGTQFFLLGLSCFFVTHIAYTTAFGLRIKPVKLKTVLMTLPFVLYYVLMSYFLWERLPADFKIPVLLYSTMISAMAIVGVLFAAQLHSPKSYYLIVGVVLFVISDSCIAFDKFTDLAVPAPRFSIMSTYILAQLSIVLASILNIGLKSSLGQR